MADPATPEPGTAVEYHGSLGEYRGPATVDGLCVCPQRCPGAGSRYNLIHTDTGALLGCARRSSFTVTQEA